MALINSEIFAKFKLILSTFDLLKQLGFDLTYEFIFSAFAADNFLILKACKEDIAFILNVCLTWYSDKSLYPINWSIAFNI